MASRSNKDLRYGAAQTMTPIMSAPKPKPNIAATVRSAIANQKPAARATSTPGIDRLDASGNRLGGRRQVGEADAATRRAALDAALRPGPAVKPAPAPAPAPSLTSPGGGMGNQARRKVIDDTVDKMSR